MEGVLSGGGSRPAAKLRVYLVRALAALLATGASGPAPAADLPAVEIRTFRSAALNEDRSYTVLLPVGYDPSASRRYPVLYLLHGKGGDHTDWSKRAPLREAVGATALIVVMPDGDDGWYTDWADGHGYEGQIVRDLVSHVDATYRTIAAREGRALAGLSMGGYGALKLALRHPRIFVSAASHSGAMRFTREEWNEDVKIFGTGAAANQRRIENDLMELALVLRRTRPEWPGPALYIDCGTEDFLYDANTRLRAFFREIDVPFEYHEWPGGHSWEYWSAHLPDQLRFTLAHLTPAAP